MIERKFIKESIKRLKAKRHIMKVLEKAGIVEVEVQRTTLATRIGIKAERPGIVIGKGGSSIQAITNSLEKDIGIENPKIEVSEVENPSGNPFVIARWVKRMLERGMKSKVVTKRAVSRVMDAGAMGVEIIVDGTVSKGNRSKKERCSQGYIKKAGDPVKMIKVAKIQAVLKQGVIGITVRIVPKGLVFPDKIDIKKLKIAKELKEKAAQDALRPAEKAPTAVEIKEIKAEVAAVKTAEAPSETAAGPAAEKSAGEPAETAGASAETEEEGESAGKTAEEKCPECGKTFKSKRGLTLHMKIHSR
ncbi:MAG: 30S ribosomal protein S3 [Candidatus Micrarchaeota archaeon]